MKTRAAVAWTAGERRSIESVDLDGPRAGEVLVELKATGICRTDPFTQLFEAACHAAGQALTLCRHAAYDHGYFFIASVIEDPLRHHAAALKG